MPVITEIKVGVRRLIALAKYENVTYDVEVTAQVQANESVDEAYNTALEFCKNKILAELNRIEASK
jgi:hypothetical protein